MPGGLLVITGATGWVGRSALQELQALLPLSQFAERVRLFASRAGSLPIASSSDGRGFNLQVYPLKFLPELAAAHPLAAIFHAAFLTRDRLDAMGQDTYVATNRWITGQVAQAVALAPKVRAIAISSGAAASCDGLSNPMDRLDVDPYGVLKREEETILAGLAPSLVLRIYALSGRFIRGPERFALGDFLLTALRGEAIRLQAKVPVLRSYGHAADITALAWRWLLCSKAGAVEPPLDAVSLSIDLLSLAHRITSLYQLPPVQASFDYMASPNRYLADPGPFLASLARHGLKPTSLEQQILETASGLVAQSGGKLGQ